MRTLWTRPTLILVVVLVIAAPLPADDAPPKDVARREASELDTLTPRSVDDLRKIEDQVAQIAKDAIPATVGVQVGGAQGSGVIVSEDGYVLTAGHVAMKPGMSAKIILHDGRKLNAKTLGMNSGVDSGMIKITEEGKWPHVEMATGERLKAGQWCVGIGHSGGVERGRLPIVRLGRVLFINDQAICSDCGLVGGDSGGPLLDLSGRVVGIHSRIGIQRTTNLHVPVKTFRDTWDRLAASERWSDGMLTSARRRAMLGVGRDAGDPRCKIGRVIPGSPAEKAGLLLGDVIVRFKDNRVATFDDLIDLVAKEKPGRKVTLTVERDDKTVKIETVLGDWSKEKET